MPSKKIENCAHGLFTCSGELVSGLPIQTNVIRCGECGEAVGFIMPQITDAFNVLNAKIDNLSNKIR